MQDTLRQLFNDIMEIISDRWEVHESVTFPQPISELPTIREGQYYNVKIEQHMGDGLWLRICDDRTGDEEIETIGVMILANNTRVVYHDTYEMNIEDYNDDSDCEYFNVNANC